jgi:hypothetical protein
MIASPALSALAWMLELLKDVVKAAALLFSALFLMTFVCMWCWAVWLV